MTIADLKAMYDRYKEIVNWHQDKLSQGLVSSGLMDEFKDRLNEYSVKLFNTGKQLEQEMDKAYENEINKI